VILPGPAGGLIDIAGRAIGEAMQKELGQTWLIDPRPGANGIVAGQMFLAAPADGYTLYLTVSGHVASLFLMKAPVDRMAFQAHPHGGREHGAALCAPRLACQQHRRVRGLREGQSGQAQLSELGNGTGAHLLPELIKIKYDIDVMSISYKGLPPGVQDLLGGRLDLAMVSTALVMQHVTAGRLKALAVVGPKRLAELPDVATMAEQGAGEAEIRSMLPLYGQKALPDAIVAKLSEVVQRVLADSETRRRLAAAYIEPMPLSPAETAIALAAEHVRLGRLIQQLGIRADGTG
jgi:tripartite-type tricarboxylate transporter receptor subunit TctC